MTRDPTDRHGTHPGRAFGRTGGGYAEGQDHPEEFKPDKTVGGFASGQEDLEEFPEGAKLGSFAKGQETEGHVKEGTYGRVEGESQEESESGE